MMDYGMRYAGSLRAAISVVARVFRLGDRVGAVKPGLVADLIAVKGDPSREIAAVRWVTLVDEGGACSTASRRDVDSVRPGIETVE